MSDEETMRSIDPEERDEAWRLGIEMASHIAAIDTMSSKVAAYIENKLRPILRDRDRMRAAINPVLTLSVRGEYVALPVSMRTALCEAYHADAAPLASEVQK